MTGQELGFHVSGGGGYRVNSDIIMGGGGGIVRSTSIIMIYMVITFGRLGRNRI